MPQSRSLSQPTKNKDYTFHPSQLSGKTRAEHVVKSLLDYNRGIIENNPEGANSKFEKLKDSPFVFMRGTADLMYRDLFGTDADKSMVLCMGDVHVENYGVMVADDGSLLWGLNDFDEANFAPFSWDVKRGACSIYLAARSSDRDEIFSRKKSRKLSEAFAEEYIETIAKGVERENYSYSFKKGNSPKVIKALLKASAEVKAKEYLEEKYLDPKSSTPKFKKTDKIDPIASEDGKLHEEFQQSLNQYLLTLKAQKKQVPDTLRVWDLARKTGSGTGSIGLWRYYALVELEKEKENQLLILEIKQERPSVLAPYVGGGLLKFSSEGSRVAYAENIQIPNANPYYGYTEIGGISYLVRERSPHKRSIKVDSLEDYDTFKSFVKACGKALAVAHLHSDHILQEVYPNMASSILHSVNPETFGTDVSGFAMNMAAQVRQDWESFKAACEEGTFSFS